MFSGFGMWEMILVFLVVLLLFGAKRLPEIGSSLGKGIREFKGSLREIEGELKLPEERRESPRQVNREPTEEEGPRKLSGTAPSVEARPPVQAPVESTVQSKSEAGSQAK